MDTPTADESGPADAGAHPVAGESSAPAEADAIGNDLLPPPHSPWHVAGDDTEPLPPQSQEPRPRKPLRKRAALREAIETILLAALVFLSVRASFQNFRVEGQSMAPTLDDGQFLIVNKLIYSEIDTGKLSNFLWFLDSEGSRKHVFHPPERGDIIVLEDPAQPGTDLIKRVIGLPGETVSIRAGVVYIGDRVLIEPYITEPWTSWNMQPTPIPERHYFVLGDNRNNSNDSRFQQIGLIPEDLIIGKAMFSYWPRDDFGFAPNESPKLADP